MLKRFLVNELISIFDCTAETVHAASKKTLVYLTLYGIAMLFTLGITTFLIAQNAIILGGACGFLLSIEIIILSTIFSFIVFSGFIYYGAYFACKGWQRYQDTKDKKDGGVKSGF